MDFASCEFPFYLHLQLKEEPKPLFGGGDPAPMPPKPVLPNPVLLPKPF